MHRGRGNFDFFMQGEYNGVYNSFVSKKNSKNPIDKKKLLREADHLTRPPRLEGAVKEAMMQPKRKKKKSKPAK